MIRIISTQKLNLICLTFVLLATCGNAQSWCGGGDWIPYNDEKCILIVQTLVNADEAASICSSQAPTGSSSLLSIKSKEEQMALAHQLYEVSEVMDNVWVDARRYEYNTSAFIWTDDKSPVRYSNWAPGFPSSDTRKGCVQMISHLARDGSRMAEGGGQWQDISCFRRNQVVCQKLQTISPGEVQRMFTDLRKRVEEMENNPVPLGFIYVQLSGQPEPNEIWKKVQFTDVTFEYAGQFLRALGGDSSEFGTIQNFSSPTLLVNGQYVDITGMQEYFADSLTVPFGSWSPLVPSGAYPREGKPIGYNGIRFQFQNTEVRPYNSAVKIWKRTA